MEEKYCFEDWYSGKVYIDTESFVFDNNQSPKLVSFASFPKEEQNKILETKRETFYLKVEELFKFYTERFINSFKKSKFKKSIIENHIRDTNFYLKLEFHKIPKNGYLESINFSVEPFSFEKSRKYIQKVLIEGENFDYMSVKSPLNKFKDINVYDPDVFTEFMYRYSVFLEEHFQMMKGLNLIKINKRKIEKIDLFDDKIFKNSDVVDFFVEYLNQIRYRNYKLIFSDFGYIHDFLKRYKIDGVEYSGLVYPFSKKKFCLYVNKHFENELPYKIRVHNLKVKRDIIRSELVDNLLITHKEKLIIPGK